MNTFIIIGIVAMTLACAQTAIPAIFAKRFNRFSPESIRMFRKNIFIGLSVIAGSMILHGFVPRLHMSVIQLLVYCGIAFMLLGVCLLDKKRDKKRKLRLAAV